MSAPVRSGRALARQRLGGIAFLVVIGLLVALTVALYNKAFTRVTHVSLSTDRAGNQLSKGADVKLRGLVVGEVRDVRSAGDGAVLDLALEPAQARRIPADVRAQLVPKTLFGEKEVDLVTTSTAGPVLHDGSRIGQDHSQTAVETERAVDDLLPLLKALRPDQLSEALNALSTALRGRGDELGRSLVRTASYLRSLNPDLPTLQQDLAGLADLANNTADASPHLLEVLDNLSASSRHLVQEQASLDDFLTGSTSFAATTQAVVAENEKSLVTLAATSRPVLALYARYAFEFPCMSKALAALEAPIEASFGGLQAGLHITLEATRDNGGYDGSTVPRYGDTGGPIHCYGLDPAHPVVPARDYYNPYDGYYDGQEVDPVTGKPPCTHTPCAEPPPGGRADDAAALRAVVAGKMGTTPDIALLLLRPAASGSTVGLS
ncbi:MAG: mammalian cell entry protein [Frankiales bacterium]|nr:mammalian cell entry protein [Frankiales bacterium]